MRPSQYIIWCKRTNDPNALWSAMPYAERDRTGCEALVTHYEETWGDHYVYQIVLRGYYPQGKHEPVFV